MRSGLALLFMILVTPTVARAQDAPPPRPAAPDAAPGECTTTTTTTVRCTGAAAPYGVLTTTPTQPTLIYPPNTYSPQLAPVILNWGDDWKVTRGEDGQWYREHHETTGNPWVWGTGIALLGGSWLAGGIGSYRDGNFGLGFVPVFGSFGLAAVSTNTTSQALYALDGVAEVGGLVMVIVGSMAGNPKVERLPVTFSAAPTLGGGTIGLAGRF